ncbi:MAG: DivIVA domain-containing protein [Nitrospira sp.]|nr:MAG: DivIVA domain-containing protein [Nitrospira sp.]
MTMGDAMRITPLDIQQMVFKVAFRGYDKEEVNRFLEELAQTVESLNRDHAVQREKIMFLEQQLADLKRTEATLSSTLLSAQSLAEDVKHNAHREADLVMKEAELKAGELIRQARVELTDTQRDLSLLQKQRLLMVERLRASLRMFERMLEVEEQEAFHDAATASEEKLEGESSPRL